MLKKFYIKVTGKSPEELQMRIKDNEKRGFKVNGEIRDEHKTSDHVDYYIDNSGVKKYRKGQVDCYRKLEVSMYREVEVSV